MEKHGVLTHDYSKRGRNTEMGSETNMVEPKFDLKSFHPVLASFIVGAISKR